MNCAPNLFENDSQDSGKPSNEKQYFTSGKAFSCSDLPSFKEIVSESSLDKTDIIDRTEEICEKKNTDRTNVMANRYENDVKDDTCNDGVDGSTVEKKIISSQSLNHEIISSNIIVKEKLLVNVDNLRKELKQLSLMSSSWDDHMKKYLYECFSKFEELKMEERSRLLSAKSDNEKVKELTENLLTVRKKVTSLSSENESLRQEIDARDISFSEKELRYRNDLARQKQYASELESAKETFEAEQQVRFNSAIGRVMKEKETALKKADEKLSSLKVLQEKSDEKLQVLFNEKEALRQEKDEVSRRLVEAQVEVDRYKTDMKEYIEETRKLMEEKDREFQEHLENEKKEAAMVLEVEKQKWETNSSGSGSG